MKVEIRMLARHRTKRSQIVADHLATILFTFMGLGVVAAVLGMVVFFAATIFPLFGGVQLKPLVKVDNGHSVAAFARDPDAPILAAAVNSEGGCELQVFLAENKDVVDKVAVAPLEIFGLFWPSGVGVDASSESKEITAVSSGELRTSNILCGHVENSVFLMTDGGGADQSSRQALVKLSIRRDFIDDADLSRLGPELISKLTVDGWATRGSEFYAKASPEAPVSRLEPYLITLAQWYGQAADEVPGDLMPRAPIASVWSDATYSGVGRVASDDRSVLFIRSSGQSESGLYLISEKEDFLSGTKSTSVEYRTLPRSVDRAIKLGGEQGIALIGGDGRLLVASWDGILSSSPDMLDEQLRRSDINLTPSGASYVSSIGGFGGNTVVIVDDAGRCTAYDIAYFALNKQTNVPKTRWQSRCLGPAEKVVEIVGSPSQRLMLMRNEQDLLRGIDLTTGESVVETQMSPGVVRGAAIQFEKNGRYLIVNSEHGFVEWGLNSEHLQGSLHRLFRQIYYEGYDAPSLSWQSASASDDFESKFSLWPLIWGTLKATFYAMLFAAPLGIAAAVYSSEMLDRKTRNFVKPAIEMMASLPSVVLGYLAAIVLAPWIENNILGVILCGLVVPCMLYFIGNLVADYSAKHVSGRGLYANRRLLMFILSGFIASVLILFWLGQKLEAIAFGGDLKAYLSGGEGSAGVIYGILFLPLVLFGLWSIPVGKRFGKIWKNLVFIVGPVLSMVFGYYLHDDLGSASLEVGGYSQRNALVICVAMGFAIIPIVYSLSEDALTSVPGSLRAGSLACGASVWQTTARVVLPTAASGIFSALMIGFGRAIGETMIVVMATGNSPVMSINPFEGLRTLAANIAVELPEAPVGGTHYRILFFSGFVLFLLTFCLNTVAEIMRTRYRKRNKAL